MLSYIFLLYDDNGNPNEEYNTFKIRELNNAKVTDRGRCNLSFRLLKPEIHTAYLVKEEDFKKGIYVFTDIQDVDKYLKWNDSKCLRELL